MNNEYIVNVEPIIFEDYEKFKEWLYPRNRNISFMASSVIGFKTKEETEKFNRAYRIHTRYDNGSIKYCKN